MTDEEFKALNIRPPQPLDKQCVQMHKLGYCVCTMVDCMWCDGRHPPSKNCRKIEGGAK